MITDYTGNRLYSPLGEIGAVPHPYPSVLGCGDRHPIPGRCPQPRQNSDDFLSRSVPAYFSQSASQLVSSGPVEVFLSTLSDFSLVKEDKVWCPMGALKWYLVRIYCKDDENLSPVSPRSPFPDGLSSPSRLLALRPSSRISKLEPTIRGASVLPGLFTM